MPKPKQFAHVQEFMGPSPEVREFSNELLAAIGQVAKDYAMESYEIVKRFDELRHGEQPRVLLNTGVSYPLGSRQLATDIAMQTMGGGFSARAAAPPPAGSLGIMGGGKAWGGVNFTKSVSNKKRLNLAEQMLKDIPEVTLQDAERIRRETGWFKPEWYTETMSKDELPAGDPGWRFEISDKDFYVEPVRMERLEADKNKRFKLREVASHPELDDAYPNIMERDVVIRPSQDMDGADGMYNLQLERFELREGLDSDKQANVLIHEIQHAVQDFEGHAQGTSPEAAGKVLESTRDRFRVYGYARAYKQAQQNQDFSAVEGIFERAADDGYYGSHIQSVAMQYTIKELDEQLASTARELDLSGGTPQGHYRAHRGEQESRDVVLRFRLHKMAEEHGVDAGDVPPYAAITSWVNPNTNEVLRVEYRKPSTPTEVGEIHAWDMDAPE